MATSKIPTKLPVIKKSWSNLATPAAQYYTGASFTIPANTRALLLAKTANGKVEEITNTCNFNATGSPKMIANGSQTTKAGSGNFVTGWFYIETGTSSCTVDVRQYGYDTTVTGGTGEAIAITLEGAAIS